MNYFFLLFLANNQNMINVIIKKKTIKYFCSRNFTI